MEKSSIEGWRPSLTAYEREFFRELSPEEIQTARIAIEWLSKKKLNASQIHSIAFRQINEEKKTIEIRREGKRIIIERRISYENSPLEKQIENAKERQKSSYFVFPRAGRRGYRRTFTPSLKTDEVNELIGLNNRRKSRQKVWTKSGRKTIIRVNW